MSKHRSTNDFPSYQQPQPDMPQPEKPKKKVGKGWKVAGGAVAVLAAVGIFAPTDGEEQDTAATTTATSPAQETTTDAPGSDTTTAPDPTTTAPEPATTAPAPAAEQDGNSIRFEAATSDGSSGSVTYVGKDMNIIQHADTPMPWNDTITGLGSKWDALGANMSVQQNGAGEVTCRMYWNDELVSENTSTGAYSIASCSLPTDL